jgi:hypothetical protein
MSAAAPVYVFILSWNRPLYLWAGLDSLYRHTNHPHRFIFADNNSADPMVRAVVHGFERRGMFHAVHWFDENDPNRLALLIRQYRHELGETFGFVESDVIVEGECWLAAFTDIMARFPQMAMLGSLIDPSDFVPMETGRALEPEMPNPQLAALVKAESPERQVTGTETDQLIRPFNPPGRLLMLRTAALDGLTIERDAQLYAALKARGYDCAIATRIRHRHLSLLNIFDYHDYDVEARQRYHDATGAPSKLPTPEAKR